MPPDIISSHAVADRWSAAQQLSNSKVTTAGFNPRITSRTAAEVTSKLCDIILVASHGHSRPPGATTTTRCRRVRDAREDAIQTNNELNERTRNNERTTNNQRACQCWRRQHSDTLARANSQSLDRSLTIIILAVWSLARSCEDCGLRLATWQNTVYRN